MDTVEIVPAPGEPRGETLQGGGSLSSLSGGDERSESESLNSSLPVVAEAHDNGKGAASERGGAAPDAALPCQSSDI